MDNQDHIDPKVIERLMKLDRLRKDGSASEGEANNATEILQRLMREHNISMATLEMAGKSSTAEGGKRTKEAAKGRAGYKYQQELMEVIAKVNFCHVRVREEWTGKKYAKTGYNIIGREVNVIAVTQTFDYLNTTIERLAREYVGGNHRMLLSRDAIAFKEGMAARLKERLKERHEQAVEEQRREAEAAKAAARHPSAAPGTGLVVILADVAQSEEDANEDFRRGLEPGTTARRRLHSEAETAMAHNAYWALRKEHKGQGELEIIEPVARKVAEEHAKAFVGRIGKSMLDRLLKAAIEDALRWQATKNAEEAAHAKETPKQKEAREAKEQRARDRYWNRVDRENEDRYRRQNTTHFQRGAQAGSSVGLDKQLDKNNQGRLK